MVRKATRGDLSAMVVLEATCFELEGERFTRRQLRGLIDNPRAVSLAAVDEEGRVRGYAVVLLRRVTRGAGRGEARGAARLYALAVDPGARGRGLGERLVRCVIHEAANRGAATLTLEVRADNTHALSLYRRLGFGGDVRLPDYYAAGVDGLRMRRELTPTPREQQAGGGPSDAAGA